MQTSNATTYRRPAALRRASRRTFRLSLFIPRRRPGRFERLYAVGSAVMRFWRPHSSLAMRSRFIKRCIMPGSDDDGRPRPIAPVVVIEPDDGHVMSRVPRTTGDRPCAIPSSSRNRPPPPARDIFSHGKRVCISLVSRSAIFASAGSIARDPRAIAGGRRRLFGNEGEEDRQFQRTGIPVPPSERSRPDGLIVEQRWLGDGIISRADAAARTCPVGRVYRRDVELNATVIRRFI